MRVTGKLIAAASLLGVAVLLPGLPGGLSVAEGGPVLPGSAVAQTPNPRESGSDAVRRRQSELDMREGRATSPYWEHFELMNTGQCGEAMEGLRNLAERGRGYEDAQHALGLCLIETGQDAEGLEWIARAADAGLAAAQATHVRLFVRRGGDYITPSQAAMWIHLYDTNPMRLLIGTGHALDDEAKDAARGMIPRTAWLDGVARARHWIPRFAAQATRPEPVPTQRGSITRMP